MINRYLKIIIMVSLGAGVYMLSGLYHPQPVSVFTETAAETCETAETRPSVPATPSQAQETLPVEEPYTPTPTELNLFHSFPEGADTSDLSKSYAGEAFQILMAMDESWMSSIYNYSDYAPLQMASRLGRSKDQVMGRYNPRDNTHDPEDPDTWTINSFKDIRMKVINGDGEPVSVRSNVIEILSMANVYTYYHGSENYNLFLDYAKKLWEASHSCSVSMSDVYYCSGCMDEEAEQREREALEAAARAEEMGLISEEGIPFANEESSSGNTGSQTDSSEDTSGDSDGAGNETTGSPIILASQGKKDFSQTDTDGQSADSQETVPTSTSGVLVVGQSRNRDSANAETANTDIVVESEAAEISGTDIDSAAKAVTEKVSETEAGSTANITTPDTVDNGETNTTAEPQPNVTAASTETLTDIMENNDTSATSETNPEGGTGTAQQRNGGPGVETLSESDTTHSAESQSNEGSAGGNGSLADMNDNSNTNPSAQNADMEKKDCPGHIDLILNMKICGLDDQKGLYRLDTIGNDDKAIGINSWQGWNDETMGYVKQLSTRDWFQDYGLSLSVLTMRDPLTSSEIEAYMDQLPENLSPIRRRIIRFALSSVGKVPYYWGGKASSPHYSGNNFGALTSPDTKGRVLRGLDCSGWINWVYWSVTGSRLPYESTSGLAVCGTRIGRESLQPGDIIIRTGADAHAIMFLGWTEDGRIRCIHESSAGVNNVTVAVRDANWPYYRSILD